MYYIYLLKWQGIPLYAGLTKRPIERYKLHYYDDSCSTRWLVRYYIYHFRKPIEMELVYCTPDYSEARIMEWQAISLLGMAGFSLLNSCCTFYNWNKIPRFPDVPEFKAKWISKSIYLDIYNQKVNIQKQYGYEEYRYNYMDQPKSISRRIRNISAKRSQLGKKK